MQVFTVLNSKLLRITLGQHKSETLTEWFKNDVFCVVLRYNDYNKRLIILSVIRLSGGHCSKFVLRFGNVIFSTFFFQVILTSFLSWPAYPAKSRTTAKALKVLIATSKLISADVNRIIRSRIQNTATKVNTNNNH